MSPASSSYIVLLMSQMRIFLADGDRNERLALQFLLDHEPGMQVTGIAVRSEDLTKQVEASHPDVVLLDWNLILHEPTEFIDGIRSFVPQIKIIILHGHINNFQALESAGADVFINKNESADGLLAAVRELQKTTVNSNK